MTWRELRADVVILACAVSAGIHGALARGHFEDGAGAGLGFVAAAATLGVVAAVLTELFGYDRLELTARELGTGLIIEAVMKKP